MQYKEEFDSTNHNQLEGFTRGKGEDLVSAQKDLLPFEFPMWVAQPP